jgi:hypothetical protein
MVLAQSSGCQAPDHAGFNCQLRLLFLKNRQHETADFVIGHFGAQADEYPAPRFRRVGGMDLPRFGVRFDIAGRVGQQVGQQIGRWAGQVRDGGRISGLHGLHPPLSLRVETGPRDGVSREPGFAVDEVK